jgi:hypothetical protein
MARLKLSALEAGFPQRRANWRGWIEWFSWGIVYVWPSGATHLWDPTNGDLTAADWERK